MIKNYYKIAWRNIAKRPFYSSLNIIGLATGILFTLLVSAYVWNELQVNKKLRNAPNQYFLTSRWKDPNLGIDITTAGPLAKRLKEDYPNLVTNYYRWDGITSIVSKGDKHFRENIQLGDSTLLSMFGFGLLHGDAATALNNPFTTVITKDVAIKYFGRTNVVGETMTIQSFSGSQHDFTITGVLQPLPENSVTALNDANHNNFFIPTSTFSYFGRLDFEAWSNLNIPSYIEVKDGVTLKALNTAINQLLQANASETIRQNLTVRPIALTDYYLQKNNGLARKMLGALSFTGLFILLMAVVNFINISISNSSGRIKEIGIRKVLGSVRRQIIIQFLTESVILVFISSLFAIGLYRFARPFFGKLIGKEIPVLSSFPPVFVFIAGAFVLLLGIAAGLYPAFVLSSLKSADSIKGKLTSIKENILLRKSLTAFQFSIACVVISAAFIVSKQVKYFFGQNLGYDKDYVVSSQVPRDWSIAGVRRMETIRSEFARMPEISEAALAYEIPNGMNAGQPQVYKAGTDSAKAVTMQMLQTDGNYLPVYQIPLKAGAFFSTDAEADSLRVELNEKAALALGFKTSADAINKELKVAGSNEVFVVKGVTADFHFGSMQQQVPPMIFFKVRYTNTYRYLSFKLKPGNIASTITAIEKKWASLLPGSSFEYTFMDDTLKNLYKTEIQLQKAAYTATLLSLIIVLLGVVALVSAGIQKRTKEIGIRKVLGASAASIVSLFMKEVLIVILIAGLIACPVAWFIMNGWLNDYAYRIDLTAQPFIITVAGLGILTALLITIQTLKAGLENPAKSLRTE